MGVYEVACLSRCCGDAGWLLASLCGEAAADWAPTRKSPSTFAGYDQKTS